MPYSEHESRAKNTANQRIVRCSQLWGVEKVLRPTMTLKRPPRASPTHALPKASAEAQIGGIHKREHKSSLPVHTRLEDDACSSQEQKRFCTC